MATYIDDTFIIVVNIHHAPATAIKKVGGSVAKAYHNIHNPLRPRSTNQVLFDLHWFLVWDHFEFDTSWHHLQSHLLPAAEWQDTLPRGSEELCPSLVSTLQAYLQGQRHRFHLQNLGQIRTSDFW